MLKRKVSAIWILILAVITAAACIFATVIYIRYGRQAPDKAREFGQFRFLKAESDSAGVSFEVINVREVGSDVVLDLRWVNRSGKPIQYGASYELFRRKDGKWEKIEAEPELMFPSIAYSINSGFTADLSYRIPAQYKLSPNERYRFQATFRFQRGSELSEKMINSLEFEAEGEIDSNGIYRSELLTDVFRTARCSVRNRSAPKPTFRPFASRSKRTQKSKMTVFSPRFAAAIGRCRYRTGADK